MPYLSPSELTKFPAALASPLRVSSEIISALFDGVYNLPTMCHTSVLAITLEEKLFKGVQIY